MNGPMKIDLFDYVAPVVVKVRKVRAKKVRCYGVLPMKSVIRKGRIAMVFTA
jgi:hypothetical protein